MRKFLFPVAAVMVMTPVLVFAQTADSGSAAALQAQIEQLLAQIKALQSGLVTPPLIGTPPISIPPVSGGGGGVGNVGGEYNIPSFNRDLRLGMKGDDVRDLQEFLTDQGYYGGPISGNYGLLTIQAVRKFQQANNIQSTGYFGVRSRALANKMIQEIVGRICGEEGCDGNILPIEKLVLYATSDLRGTVGEYFEAIIKISGGSGNYSIDTADVVGKEFSDGLAGEEPGDFCEKCKEPRKIPADEFIIFGFPQKSGALSFTMVAKDRVTAAYGKERFTIIFKDKISSDRPPIISGVKGPTTLKVGEEGVWSINAQDPSNGSLVYRVIWGDEVSVEESKKFGVAQQAAPFKQTAAFAHTYIEPGVYNPTFYVVNDRGLDVKTSITVNVRGETKKQPYFSVVTGSESKGEDGILFRNNLYSFYGKVSGGSPNSLVLFYLRNPDGKMEYNGVFVNSTAAAQTDGNGQWEGTASRVIPGYGPDGTWTAWVTVGGVKSNPVYFNVAGSGGDKVSVGKLYIEPANPYIKVGQTIQLQAMYQPPMPKCPEGVYCTQSLPASYPVAVLWSTNQSGVVGLKHDGGDGVPADKTYVTGLIVGDAEVGAVYYLPNLLCVGCPPGGVVTAKTNVVVSGGTSGNNPPVINSFPVIPSSVKVGESVSFSWGATDADGDDLGWQVWWGDRSGGPDTGCAIPSQQNKRGWTYTASHAWQKAGVYTVEMTVYDCRSTSGKDILSDKHKFNVSVGETLPNQPSITVLSPNGGEAYAAGTAITATWTQNYNSNPLVIRLFDSNSGKEYYSGKTSGSIGKNLQVLPLEAANVPSGRYRITICDENQVNPVATFKPLCDSSDAPFSITSGTADNKISASYVLENRSSYAAGEKIALVIKGVEHFDGSPGEPSEGFNVQYSLNVVNDGYSLQGGNATYNSQTGYWEAKLIAPVDTSKTYAVNSAFYCSNSSLACGKRYNDGSIQVSLPPFTFSVTGPGVQPVAVLSPNGGETYQAGQPAQVPIRWTADCGPTIFFIGLAKGNGLAQVINSEVPAGICSSGQKAVPYYTTWPIPSSLAAGNDYKIWIYGSGVDGGFSGDDSNAPFTITAGTVATSPSLTVSVDPSTPTSRDIPQGTSNVLVATFRLSNTSSEDVAISELWVGGIGSASDISSVYVNDGAAKLGFARILPSPSGIAVKLDFSETPRIPAYSSKTLFFSVDVLPSAPVGDKFSLGIQSGTITGVKSGIKNSLNFVSYGGPAVGNIMTVVSPSAAPSITVLSPNGGEVWQVGKTYEIKWVATGFIDTQTFGIDLERRMPNETQHWNIGTITSGILAKSGSYLWTIPSNLNGYDPSATYKILLGQVGQSGLEKVDESDAPFSIASPISSAQVSVSGSVFGPTTNRTVSPVDDIGTISITAPPSGSIFISDITFWLGGSALPQSRQFTLSLIDPSTGANWGRVADATFSTGCQSTCSAQFNPSYVVSAGTTKTVKVRVNSSNFGSGGMSISVKSLSASLGFSASAPLVAVGGLPLAIANVSYVSYGTTQPSITVLSPNGGEVWYPGEAHQISWTPNVVNNAKIYIYDSNIFGSGSTNYITPNGSAVSGLIGYYDWTVPPLNQLPSFNGSGSSNYKIRIDNADTNTPLDSSDAPFSIIVGTVSAPAPTPIPVPTPTPTPAPAPIPVPAIFTLTPSKTTAAPGETISVSWTNNGTTYAKDWIGFAPKGGQWSSAYPWFYTDGSKTGSKTLIAPATNGQYDLIYYENNGFKEVYRVGVSVSEPASAVLRSSASNLAATLDLMKAALRDMQRRISE